MLAVTRYTQQLYTHSNGEFGGSYVRGEEVGVSGEKRQKFTENLISNAGSPDPLYTTMTLSRNVIPHHLTPLTLAP